MKDVSGLILAGQRAGVVDPLCAQTGEVRKALIPVLGRPMLDYVVSALEISAVREPYYISGCPADVDRRLKQAPSAPGPAGSALMALQSGIKFPALMTTADHPLLTPSMIAEFVEKSQISGMDFCVGLAKKSIIQPAYPHVKRTYLQFSDHAVSGCNLFYIANLRGLAAIEFWKDAQHFRKHPLKLARKLSLSLFFKYVTGRLSLDGAFKYASAKLGIKAGPILMSEAEAAIDVDKPADLELVEVILSKREKNAEKAQANEP